jgi:hypothetical protein
MSERAIIEERVRRKEAEVQSLEKKLEAAKVYLQALSDILRAIDRAADDEPHETALRRGSAVAKAREIILKAGAPVHIDDLLTRLGREVTRETKASLTGSLAAYVRREEIFTRPAPNTFGLIELEHFKSEDEEPESLPEGFGEAPDDDLDIKF